MNRHYYTIPKAKIPQVLSHAETCIYQRAGRSSIDKKRILFFTHAAAFGGAEKSLLELVPKLDTELFDFKILFLSQGPLADAFEQSGIPIHIIETPEEILSIRRAEFFTPGNIRSTIERLKIVKPLVRAVADYAKNDGADLLYCNTTKAHLVGALAGHRAKIPVLWHFRDYFTSSRIRALYRWTARFRAGCVVCNSRFTAKQFPKHRNAQVVYSGIDPEKMKPAKDPAEVRRELGIPLEAPLIGMAGRLDPWKGHKVFLRAAARILEDIRDAHFIIVGDALYSDQNYPGDLQRLAEDYGIANHVSFTGFRLDMPDIMNIINVYAHPSEEPEPFGRGIVEAMLLGKPVIASGAGGPEEIVRHAETGVLVDPGDSVALARAAVQLIDNPEVAQAFGDNGRIRANTLFTLDTTARKINEILADLLK